MRLPRASSMGLVERARGSGAAFETAARSALGGGGAGGGGDCEDVCVLENKFVPCEGAEANLWDSHRDPTGAPASGRAVLYANPRLPSAHLWLSSAQLHASPPPLTPAQRMGVAPSVDECLDLAEGGVLLVCTRPLASFARLIVPCDRD